MRRWTRPGQVTAAGLRTPRRPSASSQRLPTSRSTLRPEPDGHRVNRPWSSRAAVATLKLIPGAGNRRRTTRSSRGPRPKLCSSSQAWSSSTHDCCIRLIATATVLELAPIGSWRASRSCARMQWPSGVTCWSSGATTRGERFRPPASGRSGSDAAVGNRRRARCARCRGWRSAMISLLGRGLGTYEHRHVLQQAFILHPRPKASCSPSTSSPST